MEQLGEGLHPLQDWVAHGTWDPTDWLFNWRKHPSGSDDFGKDFAHESDGLLRDYVRDGEEAKPDPQFVSGAKRATLTKQRSLDYLNRFKKALKKDCYCYRRLYK